jgi:hypothetical protein
MEEEAFRYKWVVPFYLKILHGNYIRLKGQEKVDFVNSVRSALDELDEEICVSLLNARGWRERITGSWFAGLKKWSEQADTIGKCLLKSEMVYAGQGYCFAMARFANPASIVYLLEYLDRYLKEIDCEYDQAWALSALRWIDNAQGSKYSEGYLLEGGLWEQFVMNKPNWDIEAKTRHFFP